MMSHRNYVAQCLQHTVETRASQLRHYWHLRRSNSVVGAVLGIVLSSIPGLNPLNASSTPSCNQKCLQTLPNDPWETKVPVENHNVKTKITVSAVTIIIFVITGHWETAHFMRSTEYVKSTYREKKHGILKSQRTALTLTMIRSEMWADNR